MTRIDQELKVLNPPRATRNIPHRSLVSTPRVHRVPRLNIRKPFRNRVSLSISILFSVRFFSKQILNVPSLHYHPNQTTKPMTLQNLVGSPKNMANIVNTNMNDRRYEPQSEVSYNNTSDLLFLIHYCSERQGLLESRMTFD